MTNGANGVHRANGSNGNNGCVDVVDISIASAPCDMGAVPSLLTDISTLGGQLSDGDREGRLRLLDKARSLVRALETPRETMLKHVGAQVRNTESCVVRIVRC